MPQSPLVSEGCINNRVSSGLIFDVDVNQNISVDTLTSGKRFKCLCNGNIGKYGYSWKRSKELFDSMP
ncbi:MAG TPA: hypothetical protein PK079_15155 [Leptospiraceae bacterium]|nr:hypothetical protein [Leptospiraceae bacterium]HMX33695.1 hypothetical protein [Leptospiraceae bacterium]HMY32048.1 hypothetical protein [Leptospiraceae bacterium]HMZ63971.1 hypothetical protein [Leptospiraceae bacterium]HNA07389.1 hypothetical protein [Leptospiraceae bacterium]